MFQCYGAACARDPRRTAERLCRKFSIRSTPNLKPGSHLPYEHPALAEVRTFVKIKAETLGIHERLILNMDQVWSTNFRPETHTLQKRASVNGMSEMLLLAVGLHSDKLRLREVLQRPRQCPTGGHPGHLQPFPG